MSRYSMQDSYVLYEDVFVGVKHADLLYTVLAPTSALGLNIDRSLARVRQKDEHHLSMFIKVTIVKV